MFTSGASKNNTKLKTTFIMSAFQTLSPKPGDKRPLDAISATPPASSGQMHTSSGSGSGNGDSSGAEKDVNGGGEKTVGGVSKNSMSPPPPAKKSKSELAKFYEATVEGRSLR